MAMEYTLSKQEMQDVLVSFYWSRSRLQYVLASRLMWGAFILIWFLMLWGFYAWDGAITEGWVRSVPGGLVTLFVGFTALVAVICYFQRERFKVLTWDYVRKDPKRNYQGKLDKMLKTNFGRVPAHAQFKYLLNEKAGKIVMTQTKMRFDLPKNWKKRLTKVNDRLSFILVKTEQGYAPIPIKMVRR